MPPSMLHHTTFFHFGRPGCHVVASTLKGAICQAPDSKLISPGLDRVYAILLNIMALSLLRATSPGASSDSPKAPRSLCWKGPCRHSFVMCSSRKGPAESGGHRGAEGPWELSWAGCLGARVLALSLKEKKDFLYFKRVTSTRAPGLLGGPRWRPPEMAKRGRYATLAASKRSCPWGWVLGCSWHLHEHPAEHPRAPGSTPGSTPRSTPGGQEVIGSTLAESSRKGLAEGSK